MRTKNKYISLIMMLFVISFFISCSPEDGQDGLPGEKGEQGIPGEDGNANVTVFTRDIKGLPWTTVGNSSSGYLQLEILAPNVLTNEVLQKSTILVYVYTSDFSGNWALLPYYTERRIRVQADVRVGTIILKKDQDGKPSTQSWHDKVKVVIITESSSQPLNKSS